MAGNGFAVTVRLIDLATGPLAKVNQSMIAVEKTAKKAAREGGLFEARDALKKMRDAAAGVAEKLGQAFTPLASLGAAGSLAGMISLADRFARTGTAVARASSLYGVGARDLQNWQGAMKLAGGSAEEATGAIANLGQALFLARNGLNPQVVRGAAQFGLDINKPAVEFMLDAAEKMKTLAPQQRRQFAQVFGLDEGTIFLLSKGRDEVERYIAVAKQHGYLTDAQIRGAYDLNFAWQGLKQSVESTGNAIGADIGKWLKPMLTHWSTWLDKMRESPAAMTAIGFGVDALAAVSIAGLIGAFGKLIAITNAWWALPAVAFLSNPVGLVAAGVAAFLATMWPKPAGAGEDEAVKKGLKAPTQGEVDRYQQDLKNKPRGGTLWDWIGGKFAPMPAATAIIPGANDPTINRGVQFFEQRGMTHEQAAGIVGRLAMESGGGKRLDPNAVNPTSGAYGIAQWLADRKPAATATGGDLDKQLELVWQELQGSESVSLAEIKKTRTAADAARAMEGYERAGRPEFTEAAAKIAEQIAGRGTLGKSLLQDLGQTFSPISSANAAAFPISIVPTTVGGMPSRPSRPLAESLAELNGRTADMLARGQRPPGYPTTPYAAPIAPAGAAISNDAAAPGDTSHQLDVRFHNAPAGMRSDLTRADGPASVSVRTHYGLPMVY